MKFVCEHCQTRYSIADEKVRQKLLRIRCKTCDNVLTLGGPEAGRPRAAAAAAAPSAPRTPAKPSAKEPVEWHLAVDGQQSGPVSLSDLAQKIIATPPHAEAYVWKDGFSGWKEPEQVALVARRLSELRAAGRAPAPPPPARPSPPKAPAVSVGGSAARRGQPSGATLGVAPGPSLPASAMGVVEFSQLPAPGGGLGEDEATQIQPLTPALLDGLAGGGARPANGHANGFAESPVTHTEVSGPPASTALPSDLFDLQGGANTPFFPPPTAAEPNVGLPVAAKIPGPTGPAAGESGLSKILGVGGIFVRRPALKYAAAGAALLLVSGVVALAVLSGGERPVDSEHAGPHKPLATKSNLDPDEQARREAERWFGDEDDKNGPDKVQIEGGKAAGKAAPARIKRPTKAGGAEAQGAEGDVTPPPVAPPPADFKGGSGNEERVVQRVLPERRAQRHEATGGGSGPTAAQLSQISAVVGNTLNQKAVQSCYNRALRRMGDRTGGRMEVVVNIAQTGRVKDVKLSSSPGLQPVHDCIKQAVSLWRFPGGAEAYATSFTLVLSGT